MGQVHVESVLVSRLPEVLAALSRAGFDVAPVEPLKADTQQFRCRRSDRDVILAVSPGRAEADEVLVVMAHPPYTIRPWKWSGDVRSFDDIADVLEGFHHLD